MIRTLWYFSTEFSFYCMFFAFPFEKMILVITELWWEYGGIASGSDWSLVSSDLMKLTLICVCGGVVKYTSHKIYHFNHFKLYKSVVLSTFTMLCNHHHSLVSVFITQKGVPIPLSSHSPFHLPNPLGSRKPAFCLYRFFYSQYFINGII